MSHESKLALERIIALCEKSRNPTMRQTRIYDIALAGIGMVSGQRAEIVGNWSRHAIQEKREPVEESREAIEARRAIVMQKKQS